MEKRVFFKLFHQSLSASYALPDPRYIADIRYFALTQKMSREDIMDHCDDRLKAYKRNQQTPKRKYQILFDFLETLSDPAWEELTQKTRFDK